MIRVRLNGRERELPPAATVPDALRALGLGEEPRGVAVAVGGEVVPRGRWGETPIADGAQVEVVTAVQGG